MWIEQINSHETCPQVTCSTPRMISSWSSRSVMNRLSFLRLLMALRRTLSISSLNMSMMLSWERLAKEADWLASSHSESRAAFLTSEILRRVSTCKYKYKLYQTFNFVICWEGYIYRGLIISYLFSMFKLYMCNINVLLLLIFHLHLVWYMSSYDMIISILMLISWIHV